LQRRAMRLKQTHRCWERLHSGARLNTGQS
jgi:hypothetical protein